MPRGCQALSATAGHRALCIKLNREIELSVQLDRTGDRSIHIIWQCSTFGQILLCIRQGPIDPISGQLAMHFNRVWILRSLIDQADFPFYQTSSLMVK